MTKTRQIFHSRRRRRSRALQRRSSKFAGLPRPDSRQDLGEIASRVRASMVQLEGRRSFTFL